MLNKIKELFCIHEYDERESREELFCRGNYFRTYFCKKCGRKQSVVLKVTEGCIEVGVVTIIKRINRC